MFNHKICGISGCKSSYSTFEISLHQIPRASGPQITLKSKNRASKVVTRRKAWEKLQFYCKELSKHVKICQLHFKKDDFVPTENRVQCREKLKKMLKTTQKLPTECFKNEFESNEPKKVKTEEAETFILEVDPGAFNSLQETNAPVVVKAKHICDICSKELCSLSSLNKHKFLHTDERPFICELCSKSFKQKFNLLAHKLIHSGEKNFACDLCDKRFYQSSKLTIHKRSHTGEKPYECSICQKRFSDSAHLIGHKRIHSGERPYTCDLCEKSYYKSYSLQIHRRTHTGEKPFECNVCYKRFSTSWNLSAHKKTVCLKNQNQVPYNLELGVL